MVFIPAFHKLLTELLTGAYLRTGAVFLFLATATAIAQHNGPVSPSCGPNQQEGDANTNGCAEQPARPQAVPAAPGTAVPQSVPATPLPGANNSVSSSASRTPAAPPSESSTQKDSNARQKPDVTIRSMFLNVPRDQFAIWTSPFHAQLSDLRWLVPLGLTTGVLIGSDQHSLAREKVTTANINRSNQLANFGIAGMFAVPAFAWAVGETTGNRREQETGLLTGEAVLDSLVVDEGLKVLTSRNRPMLNDGKGDFFNGITKTSLNSSFPSNHAILSWTIASVIAHEYPGPLTQVLVYGGASAISIARVTGRQHFPGDVVAGAAMGWLIGRQVYRSRTTFNDNELYGNFVRDSEGKVVSQASTYVPLDSWIYPELKRLASLGYIRTQFTGLQPWTKKECLRQLDEADDQAQDLPPESSIRRSINTLRTELSIGDGYDSSAQIESVYSRYTNISGKPLTDSYHFGQTLWNDFGRPYDQGGNLVTGATASAVSGRFFFYVRGEYEHAPGRAANTPAVQDLIFQTLDMNVPQPLTAVPAPTPVATTDRFYPLDIYAGVQLGGYALTFGKQSLWLGPGESAPLLLSDNADPMYMLRLTNTSPTYLPWIFRKLGPLETEFMASKLSGHKFPARPFFNLQKFSFHPTDNLEFGFTRASLWGGVGHPFTLHALERNLLALGDTPGAGFFNRNDIGDRKSGFDFSYKLPGLRKWLSVYSDLYSDDDPSPLANPRRSAVSPGLYLSHVPKISKLDFRFETTSTQSLTSTDQGGFFLYWNFRYHDSNLNKGFLFGNSTGRDARAYQGWSTYHFSPGTTLQFSYRQQKTGNAFLPGGGTQTDGICRFDWRVNPKWSVGTFVQYERWLIPSLGLPAQNDISANLQITYYPHWLIHGKQE